MSTNTSDIGVPDERALQAMLNSLWQEQNATDTASSERAAAIPASPNASPDTYQPAERNGVNVRQPQTSLHDPHFGDKQPVPSSVAGSGISPEATQANKFGAALPQTLPDTKTTTHGVVPGSVAGSGVSPSVTEHGKNFNINDPQTSHVDPHLGTPGVVPGSLAGRGISEDSSYSFQNQNWGFPPENSRQGQAGFESFPFQVPPIVPPSMPGLGISPTAATTYSSAPVGLNNSDIPFSNVSLEGELQEHVSRMFNSPSHGSFPHSPSDGLTEPAFYFMNSFPGLSYGQGNLSGTYLGAKDRAGLVPPPFDANLVKKDFPILQERVNGKPIVWLDNAATTQKPRQVIDRISYFYAHENSNIHRAAHALAARATDAYEEARKKVQQFLHAASPNEIIFVRGATEAINLVAKSWGDQFLQQGDEIVVSHLEHHANIVPWQQLAWRKGLKIRVIPVDDSGQVLLDEYARLLGPKTKLIAFTQVSNALGTVTPAKQIVDMGHAAGARVLVDGAQSVSHMPVDVQALGCDWFVFSGHKVFGPTGIGVVYGKEALLNETQPWQGGGNMIADVTFEDTKFQPAPSRFEAGTGNIADAVGLGAAIDYVTRLGMEAIHQYETYLLQYATILMRDVPGLKMIGTANEKASVLSFVFEGYRTDEVGKALNEEGIAVRAGHHCAQPILRRFGQETTVRPSLAFYNTCSDVDLLVRTLLKLRHQRPVRRK
ncbi:family 2A encapsulin nanocompartment cargo protein cysteine desulfurase [Chryseolinea sp. T2]|uniref:family 2A encapsulin nanocompartment cargo protein cysteine desulfurase n=1 Tax=Chryseolinea sp. T2 TaxID=3129255 RepID=UPI0030784257